MASRGEAREHEARRKPYHKKWICCVVSLPLSFFQGSVSFRATIVRSGMTNRSVKDCRVGRKSCALLAMTNLIGFAGKRNNFRNKTFERRCGATPRKKRPHKTKTSVFQTKTPQFCVIARPQRGRGNLKAEGKASRGEARECETKKEALSQKMDSLRRFAVSLFIYGSVSFRATIVRSGMANRSVKDCRVGRKSRALLAMTRLIGFAGKRSNFRNKTFERRCGATPRKKRPHKTKNVCFPNKNAPILCHCEERSDAAILKFEAWHPVAKHGSAKQEGSPITKNGFAASFRFLSLSFKVLFRSAQP